MTDWIFYFAFIGQMLLISAYLPARLVQRLRQLMHSYPPEEYPRLYPRSKQYYAKRTETFSTMTRIVLCLGLVLLGWFVFGAVDKKQVYGVTALYFVLQCLPFSWIDWSYVKEFKLMRSLETMRKASLVRRSWRDVISPALLSVAIAVYVAFIVFVIYVKQFGYEWFGGYGNIAGITAANLLFAGIVYVQIYGRKQNPHEAYEDWAVRVRAIGRSMLLTSIAATVYITLSITLVMLDLRDYHPAAVSLYMQLLMIIGFKVHEVDYKQYDVYKATA